VKKYWTAIALALGPAILIVTIVWEMARTNPAYTFIVNPWSIKGYETVHGWVFLWLGLALLIGGMLVLWDGSTAGLPRLGVLAYFIVTGTLLTFVFGPGTTTISIGTVLAVGVALFLSLILFRFTRSTLARAVPILRRGWVQGVLLLVIWAVAFVVLWATVVDKEVTLNSGVAVFSLLTLLAVYATAAEPRGLAANRMLIYCSMLATLVVITSAGAIRSTLIRIQIETDGVAAEYKDIQVSVGWFLAVYGALIVFVGGVGLWAKRQDLLVALTRARRQREAAEKSAAEIRAAEEAYLAEASNESR
jgi:hypothetical protein